MAPLIEQSIIKVLIISTVTISVTLLLLLCAVSLLRYCKNSKTLTAVKTVINQIFHDVPANSRTKIIFIRKNGTKFYNCGENDHQIMLDVGDCSASLPEQLDLEYVYTGTELVLTFNNTNIAKLSELSTLEEVQYDFQDFYGKKLSIVIAVSGLEKLRNKMHPQAV